MLASGVEVKTVDEDRHHSIIRNLRTRVHPGRLLEVGCQTVHFLKFARDCGWNAKGFAFEDAGEAVPTEQDGSKILRAAGLAETRLPESHFDACVLIHFLQPSTDLDSMLREVFRIVKPAGVVYITTPNSTPDPSPLQPEHGRQNLTAVSMQRLLMHLGFTGIVSLSEPGNLDDKIDASGDVRCFLARKPRSRLDPIVAHSRETESLDLLEDKLVVGPGNTPEEQRVFIVRDRQKYWVTSVDWLKKRNRSLNDVVQVSKSDLDCLIEGPPLV
jgi:SAM-dependent methyltransferase